MASPIVTQRRRPSPSAAPGWACVGVGPLGSRGSGPPHRSTRRRRCGTPTSAASSLHAPVKANRRASSPDTFVRWHAGQEPLAPPQRSAWYVHPRTFSARGPRDFTKSGVGGALLGGAILPGLTLGMKALAAGTARLPEVDLKGPLSMPALDTEAAIRSGIILGAAGAIERLLVTAGIRPETPLYLTGADAALLAPHLGRPHRLHPGLGLLGIALAVRSHPPSRV